MPSRFLHGRKRFFPPAQPFDRPVRSTFGRLRPTHATDPIAFASFELRGHSSCDRGCSGNPLASGAPSRKQLTASGEREFVLG